MKRFNPEHRTDVSSSCAYNSESGKIELNGTVIDVLNTLKSLNNSEQTVQKLDLRIKESEDEIGKNTELKTNTLISHCYFKKMEY